VQIATVLTLLPFDRHETFRLECLKEAGFAIVDCFWLQAGHAIFGGYKQVPSGAVGVGFDDALRSAEEGCRATR
jgi:hypothetical protein